MFILCTPLLWNAANAWVFKVDDRVPSHYSMVGIIEAELPEGKSRGTAFLVDDCGVLTNFHVVFGSWTVTALRPPSHEFVTTFTLTEVTEPGGDHPTSKAVPVAWGEYLGPDRQIRRAGEDWVYLTAERCLGTKYGWLDVQGPGVHEFMADGASFSVIGYSMGNQMIDAECSLSDNDTTDRRNLVAHDCALQKGDSGAPIVKRGTRRVAAIGSAFLGGTTVRPCGDFASGLIAQFSEPCSNLAVPLDRRLIERIQEVQVASGLQRHLRSMGYDVGELGAITNLQFASAIQDVRSKLGMVDGGADHALLAVVWLLYPSAS
jgi:hypothetical protein